MQPSAFDFGPAADTTAGPTPAAGSSRRQAVFALAAAGLGWAGAARASVVINQPAPALSLKDTQGRTVQLADFKGRTVVLEWTNPGCPFVVKHYGSQNMQTLQKEATARQVVWLSINSTARGHADHLAPAALEQKLRGDWAAQPTAVLMDEAGQAGRAYGARTTPHMYIVDAGGLLVYAGGIDDIRTANPADIPRARNHVREALRELWAGQAVRTPNSAPYGCSVKYESA